MQRAHDVAGARTHEPRTTHGAARRFDLRARSFVRRRPKTSFALGLLLLILIAAFAVAYMIEEPLRRTMERRVNEALKGYEVRIGALDLHPIGLSIDLENVVVKQEKHPHPPVAQLPVLAASVQWGALLRGELVADFLFGRPKVHLDLKQGRDEINDERDLEDRGWQQAAREVYPLEVNLVTIRNGEITYDDGSEIAPIRVRDLNFAAHDIRNRPDGKEKYPSPVELEAVVFDKGTITLDGAADFLAEPYAAMRGDIDIDAMPLDKLTPLAKHYAVQLEGGTLSVDGKFEYGPQVRTVDLGKVQIDGIKADYVREGVAAVRGDQVAKKVAREATDPEKKPEVVVNVAELRITRSEVGYVDREADPSYRVFVSNLGVTVRDFTNQKKTKKPGRAELEGALMGTGSAKIRATFQPSDQRTEFESTVEIKDVDLTTMNDLLRATGGFDVKAGTFALYSEVAVKEGWVRGYVKPLFGNLDVYDLEQDSDKNIFRQAYEGIVGGVGTLLENTPRDEVATQTDLSGSIENPQTSTWEIILNLVRNAFFRAILPGLEHQVKR